MGEFKRDEAEFGSRRIRLQVEIVVLRGNEQRVCDQRTLIHPFPSPLIQTQISEANFAAAFKPV